MQGPAGEGMGACSCYRKPPYLRDPCKNVRISVPVHGNQDLKTGLQAAIMKLAGIKEKDL